MSKSIDEILREAMQRGEFDNLTNKGKKLDLDNYFDTPEEIRIVYSLLKENGFVPEEVQMLKDIEILKEKLEKAKTEEERKSIRIQIEDRRLKYNLLMDRFRTHRG